MATISENLQALNEAKAAIKTAIENKGVDMTDVPFTQYAEKIAQIETGGGDDSEPNMLEAMINATKNISSWFEEITDDDVDVIETILSSVNFKNIDTYSAARAFRNNAKITRLPLFETSSCSSFLYFVYGCTKLTTMPAYDVRNSTSFANAFSYCYALGEVWIKNIKADLQVGSGTTYGHLLTLESLIHLVKELRDAGSARILTVSTVSLEKLTNVYVRTIEVTDEMRAEDDLIDEKLPFEVCESTDEGAMLITDYVGLKNWSIVGA